MESNMVLFNIFLILASILVGAGLYYAGQRNRATWRQIRFPTDLEQQKECYREACKKYDEMMRRK
jgi:hypothetical protein